MHVQFNRRHALKTVAISALSASLAGPTAAQTFPTGPIHIFVPTGPGTPPDIISRLIAAELAETERWAVIVENKPGAVQTLAGAEVLRQPADGHALYALSLPVAVSPALLANPPFKLDTDFAPLIKVSSSFNVLVVSPSVPAKTVAELVALLKSNPDKLNFPSGGFGTPAHLVGEMFKLQTGTKAAHVPYQQLSQAIADLLNGTHHYMFAATIPVIGHIEAGHLRALAVTSNKRLASLQSVPTVTEQGFPELVVEDWVGMAVRRGTPQSIVARLNAAINAALAKPKVREAMTKVGAEPAGGTPEEFTTLLTSQITHWARVTKETGMKLPQ
jgi:tripartite-type tricarboxylate transporter receptor subunit TctC